MFISHVSHTEQTELGVKKFTILYSKSSQSYMLDKRQTL